jgi:hypothetical protein
MVTKYPGPRPETVPPLWRNRVEYQVSAYPRLLSSPDSRREVITLSRYFRKPRRQSRVGLALWAGLVVLQLVLVLVEVVDATIRLLGDLW